MILVVCLSFSGYLVSNVPVYFSWLGKLSFFSYAYAALVRAALAFVHSFCTTSAFHVLATRSQLFLRWCACRARPGGLSGMCGLPRAGAE